MVSKFLTFIPGRLNPGIIESTHGIKQSSKQDDQTFIRLYTRLPMTSWVKLSLNFELLNFPNHYCIKGWLNKYKSIFS